MSGFERRPLPLLSASTSGFWTGNINRKRIWEITCVTVSAQMRGTFSLCVILQLVGMHFINIYDGRKLVMSNIESAAKK